MEGQLVIRGSLGGGSKPAPAASSHDGAAIGSGRVPRVSRLMALAIRFDELVRTGVVRDFAEIARLGHVTRARITQITNLLNLAPDLQVQLLFLAPIQLGRDPIVLRDLQPIATTWDWRKQRKMWANL